VKTLSVTDVARSFSAVLHSLERDQEEIVLVRNQRLVARLVPEPPRQDALSVFGDLYRTLATRRQTPWLPLSLPNGKVGGGVWWSSAIRGLANRYKPVDRC
jgi:antitoxin (DNA-binding transcriptional repressor) of toxin-antitoxin stability system